MKRLILLAATVAAAASLTAADIIRFFPKQKITNVSVSTTKASTLEEWVACRLSVLQHRNG